MPITNPPNPLPAKSQEQNIFDAAWANFISYITTLVANANALETNVVAKEASSVASAASATASASAALTSANTAASSANFKGAWSTLTGPLNIPASVSHANKVWLLMSNLADVTAETPGVSASWKELSTENTTGSIIALPAVYNANTYTNANGDVLLKTGVVVTKSDAVAAGYDTAALEAVGACVPYSGATLGGQIAFGAGVFVNASVSGIKYSADGITWNNATHSATGTIDALEFLNGQFVAIGTTWCGTSPDGITWTTRTVFLSGTSKTSIVFANGVYCASHTSGTMPYWSADLATWTQSASFSIDNKPLLVGTKLYVGHSAGGIHELDTATLIPRKVYSTGGSFWFAYNAGTFVAVSSLGAYGAISTDGVTWSATTPAQAVGVSFGNNPIAYGNGKFVASSSSGGGIQYSSNGSTWTDVATTGSLGAVAYEGALFFNYAGAGTTAGMWTSSDGVTWSSRTTAIGSNAIFSVAYGAGLYVAVGANTGLTAACCYSSPDGVTWTARTVGGTRLHDVTFANGLFVAVGQTSQCFTSPDGITWTSRTIASNSSTVDYKNGYWIANNSGTPSTLYYSTDPSTVAWTSVTVTGQATPSIYATSYYYVSGAWIATGNGGGLYKASTISAWKSFSSGGALSSTNTRYASDGAKMVCYCPGGSSGNSVQMSYDGKTWAGVADFPAVGGFSNSSYFDAITYQNGLFVGLYVTSALNIYKSADALTWTHTSLSGSGYTGIAYGGGSWYLSGNTTFAYTSPDLVTFTPRTRQRTPTKIVYGNSVFVGIAGGDSVVTADGYSGMIGLPSSITITGTTTYVKVK